MRARVLTVILITLLALSQVPAQALHSLDKYVNSKNLASPGLLIVDPLDGKVIAQNAPQSLRVPASVLKLISASAALHLVGPDKT